MNKVTMKLGDLTCPSCMTKIEGALGKHDGVKNVKVLFNASKIKAEFDDSETNADDLANLVTDLGYTVKSSKVKAL
ncbi:heavy-metal-associated domain-containing protein [Levilactobacillus namurensis]|uniref:Heavy-metal-associated domain-containing protein n=1 Tax=Levilactobacillus namurensis TaxID=380393 RepID=A0AAW8W3W4_9LACO|nr:heavy-metal-associated domain-containing protein [Levilactobacillus namurensis]PTM22874.1 copper chaperone [Lactobacillus sp. PFC-70]MCW3778372.1 heavy-metal-associated domain-containing protein [Levilactobacillus namurensis]MDT7013479.1 heavy-metal-associated domain-containing protein [Levilactobacillus namurensis]MDT7019705.1 heavy-metal-associated domain-containing protein [Levilactobacillus namurensis]WNN65707.1 heavy-metal-associated domain-containing protein [Levilactobacillus namuren